MQFWSIWGTNTCSKKERVACFVMMCGYPGTTCRFFSSKISLCGNRPFCSCSCTKSMSHNLPDEKMSGMTVRLWVTADVDAQLEWCFFRLERQTPRHRHLLGKSRLVYISRRVGGTQTHFVANLGHNLLRCVFNPVFIA